MSRTVHILLSVLLLGVSVFSTPLSPGTALHNKNVVKRNAGDGEEHVLAEGRTVELECSAFGNSPPVIHWLKDGVFLPQGPLDSVAQNVMAPTGELNTATTEAEEYQYDTISTLKIVSASATDTGRYTCVADLPEERKTKHFDVRVTSSQPSFNPLTKRSNGDNGAVRIYMYTDKAFGIEGPSSLYICRATQGLTRPAPTIQWSINGVVITENTPGFKIHSNGDLAVTRTTDGLHMAEIMCTAIGDNGSQDTVTPFVYLFKPAS